MDDVTLLFEQELEVGVALQEYRLVPGFSGQAGLPMEAYLRLYAVRDGADRILIKGPEDLSPLVLEIRSEDEAWHFLRFFTATGTHYLFQKGSYTTDLRVLCPGEAPGISAVTAEIAEKVGFQPPEIRLEGNEYIACRDLLRAESVESSAPAFVVRRCEALSTDGVYRMLDERTKGQVTREEAIPPTYE